MWACYACRASRIADRGDLLPQLKEGSFADPHSYFPDYTTTNGNGLVAAPRPSVVQV